MTDFCLEAKQCPHCQTLNHGNFHDYVNASVCYGPRLKAFATYCRTYQLIPSARTCEIIENIFGLHISEGTLANIIADADSNVEASVKKIANLLKKAKLAHADETGLRIEGKRNWLHVVCNKLHTYYAVHSKRGAEAMEDIGIIPAFRGRLVHDYWQPYYSYKDCKHSLCNTHHLRDLTFVNEEMGKVWAKQMFACLLDMHRAVVLAKKYGRTRLGGGTLKALQQRYEQIIKNGYIEDPSPI